MSSNCTRIVFSTIVFLIVLAPARGGYLGVSGDISRGDAVTIKINGGSSEDVYAGTLYGSYNPTTNAAYNPNQHFDMYCVDVLHNIGVPTHYQVSVTTGTLSNGALIAELLKQTVTNNDQRAALQLAIWKSEYDGYTGAAENWGTGFIVVVGSANLTSIADGYLQTAYALLLSSSTAYATYFDTISIPGDIGQSMVSSGSAGGVTPNIQVTPSPSSALLAVLGLVVFGLFGLRRRGQQPQALAV
jgi:MYXO-CTERM domain-containing protein